MDIEARTRAWIDGDPDPATAAELERILASADTAELEERMGAVLEFGTAGLRGKVEAGSNRMNRATVIRATKGLADHLDVGHAGGPVVVGRDARLSSHRFMEDVVAVLAASGRDVVYFADPTPTPIVAFAARILAAAAAVVVTASHNPPADNGYKVYAGNAAQIIPPTDRMIAEAIAAVGPANEVPRVPDPYAHPRVTPAPADLRERYLGEVAEAIPAVTGDRSISIVYTAMHGVGGEWVLGALERFGFTTVHPVAAQWEPDGRFPTVAFPNPEEPGALDLAHELGAALDADLVIANDPDTDRLAVSLPDPAGVWRPLTGNQVGSLLADFILTDGGQARPLVLNSIVSSPHLATLAAHHGAAYDKTLTGFKWIWNAALDLEAEGRGRFVFGYEEALGYSVGRVVRDKDGISAAVALAALAAVERASRRTLWDRLIDLAVRDGLWVSTQYSIVRPGTEGASEIAAAMERIAEAPPSRLGPRAVGEVTDYRRGSENRPRWLPETDLLELTLGESGRALVRPSGTEPKLKIYVDLRAPFDAGDDWFGAEAALRAEAAEVAREVADHLGF